MTVRTRLTALALASVLVACLAGAGTGGRAPSADASRPARGTLDSDRLHGAFWRPAGSDARRPALSLRRVAWTPSEAKPRRPQSDTFASVQAVVRLAASD
jgi:hypothetical protein